MSTMILSLLTLQERVWLILWKRRPTIYQSDVITNSNRLLRNVLSKNGADLFEIKILTLRIFTQRRRLFSVLHLIKQNWVRSCHILLVCPRTMWSSGAAGRRSASPITVTTAGFSVMGAADWRTASPTSGSCWSAGNVRETVLVEKVTQPNGHSRRRRPPCKRKGP